MKVFKQDTKGLYKKVVNNMERYLLITPSRVSSGLISGWIQTDTSSW